MTTMIIENDRKSDRSDSGRFGLDREHFLATVIENLSTDYLLIVQIISCCKWRVFILKLEPHLKLQTIQKRTFTEEDIHRPNFELAIKKFC